MDQQVRADRSKVGGRQGRLKGFCSFEQDRSHWWPTFWFRMDGPGPPSRTASGPLQVSSPMPTSTRRGGFLPGTGWPEAPLPPGAPSCSSKMDAKAVTTRRLQAGRSLSTAQTGHTMLLGNLNPSTLLAAFLYQGM